MNYLEVIHFNRDKEPGEFALKMNNTPIQEYSLNLWDGLAKLTIGIPKGVKVGDILCFQTEVIDITRIDPFPDEFCIKIGQSQKNTKGNNNGKSKKTSSQKKGKERQKPTYLDIPNACEVRRENWEKHNFDEKSALRVIDAGLELRL